jgi:hypothetical protein
MVKEAFEKNKVWIAELNVFISRQEQMQLEKIAKEKILIIIYRRTIFLIIGEVKPCFLKQRG